MWRLTVWRRLWGLRRWCWWCERCRPGRRRCSPGPAWAWWRACRCRGWGCRGSWPTPTSRSRTTSSSRPTRACLFPQTCEVPWLSVGEKHGVYCLVGLQCLSLKTKEVTDNVPWLGSDPNWQRTEDCTQTVPTALSASLVTLTDCQSMSCIVVATTITLLDNLFLYVNIFSICCWRARTGQDVFLCVRQLYTVDSVYR